MRILLLAALAYLYIMMVHSLSQTAMKRLDDLQKVYGNLPAVAQQQIATN